MQQSCSRCGYISDRPARFCRQCGVQLPTETETSSAATRNYEAHRTGGSAADTHRPYSSPVGDYPPETARFYQPPPGQAYSQPPVYSSYSVTPPRKSSKAPWLFVLFLAVLLIGGGMIGIVGYFAKSRNSRNIPPPTAAEIADEERQRIQEEIDRAMEEARQAMEEARQNAAEAARDGSMPPPPPDPPPAPDSNGMPAGLEKFRYEKADILETRSILGNDIVRMRTADNIGKVRGFYQKLAGNPIISDINQEGEKYIFQINASPAIVIILGPDDDDPDKTTIQLTRSRFIPNLKGR